MRIKKVKLTTDKKISIAYEQQSKKGNWDEYSLTCSEEARPEFYSALAALAPHVIEMCELPESYLSRIEVRGVSFSYAGEKEVMGATIIAQMKLHYSNTNLNLNTPHKASDSHSGLPADEMQLLSASCVKALKALCEEVRVYIRGERAQGRLFDIFQEERKAG
jgi:hypothetical protein